VADTTPSDGVEGSIYENARQHAATRQVHSAFLQQEINRHGLLIYVAPNNFISVSETANLHLGNIKRLQGQKCIYDIERRTVSSEKDVSGLGIQFSLIYARDEFLALTLG
jgi:hypothetical protein